MQSRLKRILLEHFECEYYIIPALWYYASKAEITLFYLVGDNNMRDNINVYPLTLRKADQCVTNNFTEIKILSKYAVIKENEKINTLHRVI